MLAQYLELSRELNESGSLQVVIDVSNYDYCLIQPIGTGISIESTIDGGAVEGVTDGNASLATNFVTVLGTQLSDNSPESSVSDPDILRVNVVGRYIRITAQATIEKLLVMLAKIS